MAIVKDKHILELDKKTIQMRALRIIDYSSKFLDLIPHPKIEGGKAYYIANITNEPAEEDKIGILPNEIEPSKAVQQIIELNKVKVFRDVINEEIMSLSLDRVKEFTEEVVAGMFTKFSTLVDGEIVKVLTDENIYNTEAIMKCVKEDKHWEKKNWNDTKKDYSGDIINELLDNIDFLLNPSNKNNKAGVEANSKDESSIIWLVRTDVYNFIRRKFLTSMNQPKYGDFTESLRGVIRWAKLDDDNKIAYVLFDYRKVAVPYNIKDYTEWYYGLDKCNYLRLKVSYGLEALEAIPAVMQSMDVPTTVNN